MIYMIISSKTRKLDGIHDDFELYSYTLVKTQTDSKNSKNTNL